MAGTGVALSIWLFMDYSARGDLPTFILFYPTVMLVAVFVGLGPGLLATAVSGLAALYFCLPPKGHFALSRPIDAAALALFLVIGVGICVVAQLYRRSRDRNEAYRRELLLQESEARLRAQSEAALKRYELLAANSRDIILFIDHHDGRILEANQAAVEAYGYERAELLALTVADLRVPQTSADVAAQMSEADERGVLFETLHLRRDGTRFPVEVSSRGATVAESRMLVSVIRDITDRKRAEQANLRLHEAETLARQKADAELETTRMLLETAAEMAAWTDLPEVLAGLARTVARTGSHSRVLVELWHEDLEEFEVAALTASGSRPLGDRRRLAELAPDVRRVADDRRLAVMECEGSPAGSEPRSAPDDARLCLVAPLVYRDDLVGLVTIDEPGVHRDFTPREIELVQGITAQAAVAIANARLYEAQRHIAVILQEQFIHPLPEVKGLSTAVISAPAHRSELIGGDFHDFFELPHGQVALVIGDVEGKGVRAAGLAERVRSAIRALTTVSPSPRYVLNNVNRLLLREGSDQFVTSLLMIIDPVSGMSHVASAGHPPVVRAREGGTTAVRTRFGPPLGTFDWEYEQTSVRLQPGDTIVAYTDGVSESRRGQALFGEAGVIATVHACRTETPDRIVRQLHDTAIDFSGELRDDLQVVALRFTGKPAAPYGGEYAEPTLRLAAPNAPWQLVDVRGSIRDFLEAHQVSPEAIADLVLCVGEACTNVLRHSGSQEPAEVSVAVLDHRVEVHVRDRGSGMDLDAVDLKTPPDPLQTGGRGLYLIRALSERMQLLNDDGLHLSFSRTAR